MHESVIAQELVERIAEETQKGGCKKALGATVHLGVFSGVVPEALAFAFDLLRKNHLSEVTSDCELQIQRVPVRCHCEACNFNFETTDERMRCPSCAKYATNLSGGYDLFLARIEAE